MIEGYTCNNWDGTLGGTLTTYKLVGRIYVEGLIWVGAFCGNMTVTPCQEVTYYVEDNAITAEMRRPANREKKFLTTEVSMECEECGSNDTRVEWDEETNEGREYERDKVCSIDCEECGNSGSTMMANLFSQTTTLRGKGKFSLNIDKVSGFTIDESQTI